jgi:hypothetical protein
LGLLIKFIPESLPIFIGIDDTIERRKGKKIKAIGCYRDAVRSSQKYVVKCFGLKWLSMMLIVLLPWSDKYWSLPFLTVLTPSESANREAKKQHKTLNCVRQADNILSRRNLLQLLLGRGGGESRSLSLIIYQNTGH